MAEDSKRDCKSQAESTGARSSGSGQKCLTIRNDCDGAVYASRFAAILLQFQKLAEILLLTTRPG
jgi:hypothetical protein